MQIKFLVYLVSIVLVALGATVQDVLTDLADLMSQASSLDDAIHEFPDTGGTLAEVLEIHNQVGTTLTAINKTANDVQSVPAPVSAADDNSVIGAVNDITPIIEDGLMTIVNRKPAIEALLIGGIPALVKQDLSNLKAGTDQLANALIAAAPQQLVDEANEIKSEIDDAFAKAIAAYT